MLLQSLMQELPEHGGGLFNELLVVLERCVGVCWQGLYPDAYLIHHLYDLPPYSTPTIQSCKDPVFSDSTTYPLAVTADLIDYLKMSSLWVYMIDDSKGQSPKTYLAKTQVPLQALITGRPIKGKCNLTRKNDRACGSTSELCSCFSHEWRQDKPNTPHK